MFCTQCGKQNPDEAQQCAVCGAQMVQPPAEGAPTAQPQTPDVPPQQPAAGPPPAEAPVQDPVSPTAPRTSGLAVASLILGILGLFTVGVTALVGLGLGIGALVQMRRRPNALRGQGLAIGGIAMSVVALVMIPVFLQAFILFPVFAKAREKARQTACVTNVKKISMALLMYSADNDESFPYGDDWCDAAYPHIRNKGVFQCPSLQGVDGAYAYNSAFSGAPVSAFRVPAQVPIVFDATGGWNSSGGPELVDPRHNDGANIGFGDGHAKWVIGGEVDATFAAAPGDPALDAMIDALEGALGESETE